MTPRQELLQISELLRTMIVEEQTDNRTFINTVETLLTLLEEYLEE